MHLERLAWIYNHIHNDSIDTRIQIWSSTKLNAFVQLGQYGWRERIEFCFACPLAGACQLAVFRPVVGSLWQVNDTHLAEVTQAVYGAICVDSNELDVGMTAQGLHQAVRELTERIR